MFTLLNRYIYPLLIGAFLFSLQACSPSDAPVAADAQQEQSVNPAVRLSGNYACIRLQLDNGYVEGRGQLKGSGYTVRVQAKGDSAQFALTGDGTAGRYDQLDLGTYAIDARTVDATRGYFTIKKDILNDYNAVTVIDRTVGGAGGKQITYTFPITLYQFIAGTPRAGQYTPVKATDIFSTTQRVVGIFTVERSAVLAN
ncbi:hypothetical protein GGR92_004991 [Spirosoma lacussanchae]|uniref:hypothetical protein n=1 Tax=Spirosoma lacussanchae TaxID=1884249 RepID=UPI001FE4F0AF|nr:hypothetical protein [Spirosoma lacussanchae]